MKKIERINLRNREYQKTGWTGTPAGGSLIVRLASPGGPAPIEDVIKELWLLDFLGRDTVRPRPPERQAEMLAIYPGEPTQAEARAIESDDEGVEEPEPAPAPEPPATVPESTNVIADIAQISTEAMCGLLAECTAELDKESFWAKLRALGFNPHQMPLSAWCRLILNEERSRPD